jgi:hypothetical protein
MAIKSIVFSAVMFISAAALAVPVTIDFESIVSPGDTLSTQFVAQGVVLNSLGSVGNDTFGGVVIVPSPSNYVGFGDGLTITFVDPANPAVPAVTDSVSFANLGLLSSAALYDGYTVSARNISGVEIGSATVPPIGPSQARAVFDTSFSVAGIHSLVFTRITNPNFPGGGIVAFDTLRFESVTPVPEPAAPWSLGLAMAGLVALRRSVAPRIGAPVRRR